MIAKPGYVIPNVPKISISELLRVIQEVEGDAEILEKNTFFALYCRVVNDFHGGGLSNLQISSTQKER